jgi:hypothetical protein
MESAISTKYQGCGMWTDTFAQLHEAVLAGAPAEEIQRLEAAELAEAEAGQR